MHQRARIEYLAQPYINGKINILREQKLLPDLPKKIVRPKIIVGLEALGRASDRLRLLQFMQDLAGTLGAEVLAQHINLDDAIKAQKTIEAIEGSISSGSLQEILI